MQTFLPYPNFAASMKVLDMRRLGKQRVEALQILNALCGQSKGWVNHPATRMWRGYQPALRLYLRESILEWVRRGYSNGMDIPDYDPAPEMPPWLGRADIHASHRSNLLRKDPAWYSQFKWQEPNDLQYVWPTP
jgi:hypothetical protein